MKNAVIEFTLGGIELLIYESNKKKVSVVYKDRFPLSLACYIAKKELSERGIEKLVSIIMKCKSIIAEHNVKIVNPIMPSFLKSIKNINKIIKQIHSESDYWFDRLSKKTTVFCDFLAAREFKNTEGLVVIDTGSGSTQLVDMSSDVAINMVYINVGSAKLFARFTQTGFPDEGAAEKIKKYIDKKLKTAFFDNKFSRAVLIGNVSYSIAKIYADFYNLTLDDNIILSRKKLKEFLLLPDAQKSSLILKHAPERIKTIISSIMIICKILKKLRVEEANVRNYGIIDGYTYGVLSGSLPVSDGEAVVNNKEDRPIVKTQKNKKTPSPVKEKETILKDENTENPVTEKAESLKVEKDKIFEAEKTQKSNTVKKPPIKRTSATTSKKVQPQKPKITTKTGETVEK